MTKSPLAIAWLGTGLMGAPMAVRLLEHQYQVRVWNRTLAKAQPLERKGARLSSGPKEALADANILVTMLSDFPATKAVLSELDFTGKTLIQMATIAPEESRSLAQMIREKGGDYLEAPLLGSIPEAKSGNLIIMIGGKQEVFNKVRPVLEILGSELTFIGEIGQAAALKLALNQLIASLTVAFATSLAFVETHDVAVDGFMKVLRKSALYAPTFDKKLPRMHSHDYTNPNFPTEHLLKDIRLFLHSANEFDSTAMEAVAKLYQKSATDHRFEDYSCVFEAVNPKDGK